MLLIKRKKNIINLNYYFISSLFDFIRGNNERFEKSIVGDKTIDVHASWKKIAKKHIKIQGISYKFTVQSTHHNFIYLSLLFHSFHYFILWN